MPSSTRGPVPAAALVAACIAVVCLLAVVSAAPSSTPAMPSAPLHVPFSRNPKYAGTMALWTVDEAANEFVPVAGRVHEATRRSLQGASPHGEAPAHGLIVVFRPDAAQDRIDHIMTQLSQLERADGGRPDWTPDRQFGHALKGFSAQLSPAAVAFLSAQPEVETVEVDLVAHAIGVDLDSAAATRATRTLRAGTQPQLQHRALADQAAAWWHLDRIDGALDGTYRKTEDGAGTTVYVLDTGARFTHTDFATGRAAASTSQDFVGDAWGAANGALDCTNTVDVNYPPTGHGTHVASTAIGTQWGVAKAASVRAFRVLDCTGSGSFSGIIAAIDAAVAECPSTAGDCVISMSLGGGPISYIYAPMADAIDGAVAAGIPVTVAAGNSNDDACLYTPAQVASAYTVGATARNDNRAYYSNFGTCVDIFAPGGDFYEGNMVRAALWTSDTGAQDMQGTSMATPVVAGAFAAAMSDADTAGLATQELYDYFTCLAERGAVGNAGAGSPNRLLHAPPAGWPTWAALQLVDSDGDGVGNCVDECPNDYGGMDAVCGCGFHLVGRCRGNRCTCEPNEVPCAADADADGVCDSVDACLGTAAGCGVDAAGCAIDTDGDGTCDANDPCPTDPTDTCGGGTVTCKCAGKGGGKYKSQADCEAAGKVWECTAAQESAVAHTGALGLANTATVSADAGASATGLSAYAVVAIAGAAFAVAVAAAMVVVARRRAAERKGNMVIELRPSPVTAVPVGDDNTY